MRIVFSSMLTGLGIKLSKSKLRSYLHLEDGSKHAGCNEREKKERRHQSILTESDTHMIFLQKPYTVNLLHVDDWSNASSSI